METIKAISEYSLRNSEGSVAGFKVETSEQSILLYIDDDSCCCETWGYFWCNDNPQEFVGAELLEVSFTDTALNTQKLEAQQAADRDSGGIMFVNFKTSAGVLQFVAYNSHNGYYGHRATVKSLQLTDSTVL